MQLKKYTAVYLPTIALIVYFFFGSSIVFADVTNNLSIPIGPNGDVPMITVACTPGHAYTEALYNDSLSYMLGTFGLSGGMYRKFCGDSGTISFDGWNMNTVLDAYNGVDNWTGYIHSPFKYEVIDTTNEGGCASADACAQYNITGAWEGYRSGIYIPSTTCYNTEYAENACTLGAGPVWSTTAYERTWTNVANGDGSGNYVASSTPPVATTTPPTGNSNVLFLPGLEASRLYIQTPSKCPLNCEDQLWEPNTLSDVTDLYLDSNGKSINQNIYTKDIIGTTNILPVFTQSVYQDFISSLDKLRLSGKINAWTPYAYDWRQGIQNIVDNGTPYQATTTSLIATLQSLVDTSKNGKVTIIAHSNGGLLAKALIKKLEDMKASGQSNLIDHIDNLVMIASPQIGTPDAMASILDGYGNDINILNFIPLLTPQVARDLAQNMPSAYGLLPSSKYFSQTGIISPASFSSSTPQMFINKYGGDVNTYQEEHSFMIGTEGRSVPSDSDTTSPLVGNSALLAQSETLHSIIDNMTIPSSIKVIDIAGWGKDTLAGMTYGNDTLDPVFTFRGDGTVVEQSALYGDYIKYWIDLSNSTLEHKNIMNDSQILSFLNTIIENTGTSTLSSIEPIQTGNRLHLSVHSPVSIGVYDSQGNFTGKVCDDAGNCTVQENIPGSTYFEFGEGKYVNLGQGNLQKAVLQGTDTGTFSFDYQTVTPSGQTTTVSFTDIPVTTQTQATITTNPTTQTPQLALDVTGNGTTDFTLAPSTVFDPITYLQVMEATINSLDLTPAKIKAFNNRVDNIIKLIQKGKVDKTKLKADKFKTVLQKVVSKPMTKSKPKKLSKTDAQTLLDLLNGLLDNLG